MSIEFELPKSEAPLPRMPLAWVMLAVLFAALIATALSGSKSGPSLSTSGSMEAIERSVNLKMSLKSFSSASNAPKQALFDDEIESLLDFVKKDPEAVRLRAVLRAEDNKKPFGDDLKQLEKSKAAEDQAYAKLLTSEKLDKSKSTELLKSVGQKDLSDKILRVHIEEKLGNPDVRSKTFSSTDGLRMAAVGGFGCMGFMIGSVIWLLFLSLRSSGRWTPKGVVFGDVDLARTERLVLAAVIVTSSFLLGQISAALLESKFPIAEFLPVVFLIASIGYVFTKPIGGYRITPYAMGFRKSSLGQDIVWGIGAVFANIPIMLVAIAVTAVTSRFLPGGAHPVTEQLSNPTVTSVLRVLFFASVVAPIWEEIVFRGMLFPAIANATRSIPYGIIGSSVLFAAIHPQGAVGVIPLATIGAMLCFVGYQRKSVVSGIVFHAIHNGATLIGALLLAPLLK